MAVLYGAAAWGIILACDVLLEPLVDDFEAAMRIVFIALLVIAPIALVLGWLYDITADGIVRTSSFSRGARERDRALQRVDYLIITPLVAAGLAIVVVAVLQILSLGPPVLPDVSGRPVADDSLVVLPFSACPSTHDGDVAAAVLADDIRNRLAESGALRVKAATARTRTVFAKTTSSVIASSDIDPVEIGRILGVRYVMQAEICDTANGLSAEATIVDNEGFLVWRQVFETGEDSSDPSLPELARRIAHAAGEELGDDPDQRLSHLFDPLVLESHQIGQQYMAAGDRDKARAAFERALLLDPDFPPAMWYLALLDQSTDAMRMADGYRKAKERIEGALAATLRLLREEPRSFRLNWGAGLFIAEIAKLDEKLAWRNESPPGNEVLLARYREAEQYLREAIAINPSATFAHVKLAEILQAQDRGADALSILEQVQPSDPFNISLNSSIARMLAERGRLQEGIALLRRFEQLPDVPDLAFYWQAELLWTHNHWDQKLDTLVRMLKFHPDTFRFGGNRMHLGFVASDLAYLGLTDEATEWYRLTSRLPMQDYAHTLVTRMYRYGMGQTAELHEETMAELATMSDDDLLGAWPVLTRDWIGEIAKSGDQERAIRLLERIRAAPGHYPERDTIGSLVLARTYRRVGRDQDADAVYEQVVGHIQSEVTNGIRHPDSLSLLANAYVGLGERERAIQALQLAYDFHYRKPWWRPPYEFDFDAEADPRVASIKAGIEADLRAQATRVQTILAEQDMEELLAAALAGLE